MTRRNIIWGLKPFGCQVVERMNDLGMIIDVSHLSEGGFYDVAKLSKKTVCPLLIPAPGPLCNHRRNLSDDQLRTLGNAGGVAGGKLLQQFSERKLGAYYHRTDHRASAVYAG